MKAMVATATNDIAIDMPIYDDGYKGGYVGEIEYGGSFEGEINANSPGLSNVWKISIVIAVCAIIGITLGIILGKRAAKK